MNKILVTGGAGYIGSHTVLCLLEAGYDVTVLDNLCNSSKESLNRVAKICGHKPKFIQGDIRDRTLMKQIFANKNISAVIHFAGLKAVGESIKKPLEYYDNNVFGTLVLCQAMQSAGLKRLVFSSSATVYGKDATVPYVERQQRGKTSNPYGASKAVVEQALEDLFISDPEWSIALLRYFNPIGAHPSGLIGEDPLGIPNNLMPYMAQVALGRRDVLSIFGSDYPTYDGTCRRDYIHVVDLALGHQKALEWLNHPGIESFNLGSGRAFSVLELLRSFESVIGRSIPHQFVGRREGDLAEFWADPSKAEGLLGWKAELKLDQMMRSTWNWQKNNPDGYACS